MKNDLDQAVSMKLILTISKELSDLKINFHKSEFFAMERPKKTNRNINKFLDVRLAH
jgi:hypothetical protein